jgi:hypothetical protein
MEELALNKKAVSKLVVGTQLIEDPLQKTKQLKGLLGGSVIENAKSPMGKCLSPCNLVSFLTA